MYISSDYFYFFQHIEKQISINKPFFFIGYSFGVIIALEVATLLENKNYFGKVAAVDGAPDYLEKILKQYSSSDKDEELETILLRNIVGLFAPMEVLDAHKVCSVLRHPIFLNSLYM